MRALHVRPYVVFEAGGSLGRTTGHVFTSITIRESHLEVRGKHVSRQIAHRGLV
jgi:hypothetical protein